MEFDYLEGYQVVQAAAKKTLIDILPFIKPGQTEASITERCREIQQDHGVQSFWYKALPAVVLVGERTTLALSKTAYQPSDLEVREEDLVTIDLNPEISGYWGDYARSYYVEDGQPSLVPRKTKAFIDGANVQRRLHQKLFEIAHPEMTFDALYQAIHTEITQLDYLQLDYIGHSIDRRWSGLEFIQAGPSIQLKDVEMFTLEPHIRHRSGTLGFKHENIYFFEGDRLVEL